MAAHLKEDIALSLSLSDMALFSLISSAGLPGMICLDVDDMILCGNNAFLSLTRRLFEKFDSTESKFDNTTFPVVHIFTKPNFIALSQSSYIYKLSNLAEDSSSENYRSLRVKLARATQNCP